jgi:hypothetical protein
VLKEAVERSSFKVDCVLCYARSTLHDNTLLEYLPFFQVNILDYPTKSQTKIY